MTKVDCTTLTWNEVRSHLVLRKHLRGRGIDSETFDAICEGRTEKLSKRLLREISVFMLGYNVGRQNPLT